MYSLQYALYFLREKSYFLFIEEYAFQPLHPVLKIKAAKVTKVLFIAERNWFAERYSNGMPSETADPAIRKHCFMKVPS